MSYEENKQRRAGSFRTGSDIFMGLFYAMVGAVIMYGRGMRTIRMPDVIMDIPAFVIYILGTMLIVGGLFRFYRGMKSAFPKKE